VLLLHEQQPSTPERHEPLKFAPAVAGSKVGWPSKHASFRPACCGQMLAEPFALLLGSLARVRPWALMGAHGCAWGLFGVSPGVSLATPWHLAELIHTSSRHLGSLPLALLARQTFDLIGQHLIVSGQRGAVYVL
jgi:hypothetical protein